MLYIQSQSCVGTFVQRSRGSGGKRCQASGGVRISDAVKAAAGSLLSSPQQQRHQRRGHSLPVGGADLSVRLRLPRPAHQVRPQTPQTALIPADEAHRTTLII